MSTLEEDPGQLSDYIKKIEEEFEGFGEIYTLPRKEYRMSVFGITQPSGFRMNARWDTNNLLSFLRSSLTSMYEKGREDGKNKVVRDCLNIIYNFDFGEDKYSMREDTLFFKISELLK